MTTTMQTSNTVTRFFCVDCGEPGMQRGTRKPNADGRFRCERDRRKFNSAKRVASKLPQRTVNLTCASCFEKFEADPVRKKRDRDGLYHCNTCQRNKRNAQRDRAQKLSEENARQRSINKARKMLGAQPLFGTCAVCGEADYLGSSYTCPGCIEEKRIENARQRSHAVWYNEE